MGLPARLTDPWFEAEFYGRVYEDVPCIDPECGTVAPMPHNHSGFYRQGAIIEGAQGLWLWCPCKYPGENCHGLIVPFANPRSCPGLPPNHGPVSTDGHHPRWNMSGNGLDDLTLAPSVLVGTPGVSECWHGHIINGEVR